ncbi:helix-turn-helix transcriptional regulator [Salegentibacter sp. F188]|uniref:Helix-turn-helix transcriptional regulator n=1 Tax=Autumnicola patrickiae TaxID=3075591 RepID=A0ABU3E4Y1_9FLAO|nr:helix-turn-helix transcriptional regulator [Salegentibacter sp. F188]MDT0690297.1 helix-turn-helix transcriptional regulator [Salegentibacter sp. F188]
MTNNLNSKVSKTATHWKVRAKNDRANRRNINRAQEFALDLMEFMETHKITQKELANKMEVSPQQVNKILRAKANLTFDTLDKIADALNVTISSPKIEVREKSYSRTVSTTMQVVHRHKQKEIAEDLNTVMISKKNPFLSTTLENMNEYLDPVKEN